MEINMSLTWYNECAFPWKLNIYSGFKASYSAETAVILHVKQFMPETIDMAVLVLLAVSCGTFSPKFKPCHKSWRIFNKAKVPIHLFLQFQCCWTADNYFYWEGKPSKQNKQWVHAFNFGKLIFGIEKSRLLIAVDEAYYRQYYRSCLPLPLEMGLFWPSLSKYACRA